ncbi:hypothetical protein ACHAWF_018714 [Thalassiosira exigua]
MAGNKQKQTANAIVYLTRHGARIDSEDSRWLSKCSHDRADDPHLSPSGQVGAVELARKMIELRDMDEWTTTLNVVSSPYLRCVETADEVARALGTSVFVEPGIAEVNFSNSPGFLDTAVLKQQFHSIDDSYKPALDRGELPLEHSDGACARRAAEAARIVTEQFRGPILFVGHGASCLGIAGQLGQQGYVGYTSLSKFVRNDGGTWRCAMFGNVCHLSDKQTSLDSAW